MTANKAVLVRPAVGIWIRVRKSKSFAQPVRILCTVLFAFNSLLHSISEDCGGLVLVREYVLRIVRIWYYLYMKTSKSRNMIDVALVPCDISKSNEVAD